MHWPKMNQLGRTVLGALCAWAVLAGGLAAEPIRPEFSRLEQLVEQYFYNARSRNKPMLLTQSQVRALMQSLQGMRIYIPGRSQIVRSFPHDREFFTRFVLDELAREPALAFPDDPTFLLQRVDAMCSSHQSIRQLTRLSGKGETFSTKWVSDDPLIPSLETPLMQDILEKLHIENAAQASPRRRNYTIKHLLEALESAYHPAPDSGTVTTSLNALGR